MRRFTVLVLGIIMSIAATAQMPIGGGNNRGAGTNATGSFYGKLVDSKSGKPVEFASVQLMQNKVDSATKKRKDVSINGMLTKANGEFRLENIPLFGQFKLHVTAIGYKDLDQTVSFSLKMPSNNTNN